MRIPMTQIQTASVAAVPQQAARHAAAASTPQGPATAQTLVGVTEKLAASNQAGDRDAQEQYSGDQASHQKTLEKQESNPENDEQQPPSIWNLAAADDSQSSDLDIRG